jgi:hypothetical protein
MQEDRQVEMLVDLTLKINAIERLLISKGVFTEGELIKELEWIGTDLATLVHNALIVQMESEGKSEMADIVRSVLAKNSETLSNPAQPGSK